MTEFLTLLRKELLRFWKVGFQTVCAPVLTALLAIPLLGEILHPAQWSGWLIVLLGIYLVHRSREAG